MPRPSYANVMSTVALFIALGGASYAAVTLPRSSVGNRQLKANAVTGGKVKNGSLSAADFGSLPAGPTGTSGVDGAVGATGATGATGSAGSAGAAGPAGAVGVTGATGAAGVTGATGSTGSSGTNGTTGTNGTAGATGATGATGSTGGSGATGGTGATGSTGSTGGTGATGSSGVTTVASYSGVVSTQAGNQSAWTWLNTSAVGSLTLTAGQRITGAAQVPLYASAQADGVLLGLCYQLSGGSIKSFLNNNEGISSLDTTERLYGLSESVASLAAGSYKAGPCIINGSGKTVNGDTLSGWVMVTG